MVSSSGYVAGQAGAGGGYRLDHFEAVFKGRLRELLRTVAFVVGLVVAQWPLRQVAEGRWSSGLDMPVEIPGRLSLVLDAVLVLTYLLLAYRTFGLLRSFRPPTWVFRANQVGLAVVLIGAAADVWENVTLWEELGRASDPSPALLSVSFTEAFGGGPDFVSFSQSMIVAVVLGLLIQTVTLTAFVGARERNRLRPGVDPDDHPTGGIVVCCSGGGIRSAAFSLGGIQALSRKRIYQRARAVIGVSGGGYMGAACHVVRWNPRDQHGRGPGFPWTLLNQGPLPFASPSPETQWLRRHTRYVLDTLRVAVQGALSLAFGIAVNLLLVTAFIGGTAWVLAWLLLASRRLVPWDSDPDVADDALRTSISSVVIDDWTWLGHVWWIPVAGAAMFVLEKVSDRFVTLPRHARGFFRFSSSWFLIVGAGVCALLLGIPWLLGELSAYAARSGSAAAGLIHQLGLIPSAVCDQVLAGGQAACGVTPAPAASATTEAAPTTSIAKVGGVSLATVVSAILAVLASVKGAAKQDKETSSRWGAFAQKVWNKVKDPIVPWLAVSAIVVVAVAILLRWLAGLVAEPDLLGEWRYALWFAGLIAAVKVGTDANRTSLHHFFRERISYAFLVRRGRTRIESVPYRHPLRFSQASPRDGGPRLVSCAVANVSDDDVVPSKRGCIPFVFDDTRIGLTDRLLPESAAQRPSACYEFASDYRYRDATIPAALAMSAAAFSPMVGRENVKIGPYRAVLALANARLGVWLPNPLWLDEGGVVRRLMSLGRADEAASIAFGRPRGEVARASRLHLSGKHWTRLEALHLALRRTVSAAESPGAVEALGKAEEIADAFRAALAGRREPPEPVELSRLVAQFGRAEAEARSTADRRAQDSVSGSTPGLAEGRAAALQLALTLALAQGRLRVAKQVLQDDAGAETMEALSRARDEVVGAIGMLRYRLWALDRPLREPRRAATPWWSLVAPAGEGVRTVFKKPGLTRLVKEGVGKASVFDRFLYVTDGGHYDNLGLVEALRGRPDLVYVLDASNDPEDTFRTLGRSIATARMDLDCEIVMDPRGMRRLKETRSGSAWCHGRFVFEDGHRGTIFMAKAIMLEGLSWDIETYSRDNVDFPRTTTNNQLYSEFDFEAYRALGQSAVERMLGSVEHVEAEGRLPLFDPNDGSTATH